MEEPDRVEDQAPDDPRRYEDTATPPPEEASGDERAEQVAGEGSDVTDPESYEGGLPA